MEKERVRPTEADAPRGGQQQPTVPRAMEQDRETSVRGLRGHFGFGLQCSIFTALLKAELSLHFKVDLWGWEPSVRHQRPDEPGVGRKAWMPSNQPPKAPPTARANSHEGWSSDTCSPTSSAVRGHVHHLWPLLAVHLGLRESLQPEKATVPRGTVPIRAMTATPSSEHL